jgi:peptidoglycan/xylan/chitin deacetylase (PgdA/CDA1 family)
MTRSIKRAVFGTMRFSGMFSLLRNLNRGSVQIICFHGIWQGSEGFAGDTLFMKGPTFERQLDTILELGYSVLPLDEVITYLRDSRTLPRNCAVLTIDDGWSGTWRVMAPALQRRNLPATLYVDTGNLTSGFPVPHVMARYLVKFADTEFAKWPSDAAERNAIQGLVQSLLSDLRKPPSERMEVVCDIARRLSIDPEPYLKGKVFQYMSPEDLAEIEKRNVNVQLHTHSHSLHDFSRERIRQEIDENRRQLASIVGRPPETFRHFCYPSGVNMPGCASVLAEAGILSATTTDSGVVRPGSDPHFLPRFVTGEDVSALEIEADLCGFSRGLRRLRSAAASRR